MTEPIPIRLADLERALKHRAQDAADTIAVPGNHYSNQNDWTEDHWHGYAAGQSHLLSGLAERFEVCHSGLRLHQIDGALGERYRRQHPAKNQFHSRSLNNLVNAIRDLRIRMRDDYILASYADDIAPKEKRLRKLGNSDHAATDGFWRELETVKQEMAALRTFNSQCLTDKIWFAEYFRRLLIRQASARAIEVLESDPDPFV
jgi:hypothetical protein